MKVIDGILLEEMPTVGNPQLHNAQSEFVPHEKPFDEELGLKKEEEEKKDDDGGEEERKGGIMMFYKICEGVMYIILCVCCRGCSQEGGDSNGK